jgi:hypothetical protein
MNILFGHHHPLNNPTRGTMSHSTNHSTNNPFDGPSYSLVPGAMYGVTFITTVLGEKNSTVIASRIFATMKKACQLTDSSDSSNIVLWEPEFGFIGAPAKNYTILYMCEKTGVFLINKNDRPMVAFSKDFCEKHDVMPNLRSIVNWYLPLASAMIAFPAYHQALINALITAFPTSYEEYIALNFAKFDPVNKETNRGSYIALRTTVKLIVKDGKNEIVPIPNHSFCRMEKITLINLLRRYPTLDEYNMMIKAAKDEMN